MSDAARAHLHHLAGTIGPRGSCTLQEEAAARYCREILEGLGYDVGVQEFRAPRSGWAAYSIASGLMLATLAADALWRHPAVPAAAALLTALVAASVLLHLTFHPSPLVRLVPAGTSRNVYAVAPPSGPGRRTVVLVGHIDTHRTPIAMASPRHFRLFRGLTTLGVAALLGLALLLALHAVSPGAPWLRLALAPAAVVVVLLAVTLHPEVTRYTAGANDNASGAAAVLALAARLRATPLARTSVWLLNSGAEEVGATGPVHLLRRHPELRDADWLVLDTIAGRGTDVCLITAEQVLLPMRADPALLAASRAVAARHPHLGVREHHYRGLFSEHSPLVRAGCRSLAIINFTPQGALPRWHTAADTVDGVDLEVLDRTEAFVWALLERLDAEALLGEAVPAPQADEVREGDHAHPAQVAAPLLEEPDLLVAPGPDRLDEPAT